MAVRATTTVSRMRVVLVGPTHPYKGGIAQHTTLLAHRLAAAGHEVDLWSWSEQYPQRLYPGQQRVPDDQPELPVYPRTSYPLSWRRPDGWLRAGRRMAGYDVAVVVVVTPVQAPAYLAMISALRARSGTGPRRRTRVVALCHNVLPHERGKADLPLTKAVLSRADALLVHSEQEKTKAESLAKPHAKIVVTPLPPLALTGEPGAEPSAEVSRSRTEFDGAGRRLLFFGMVRRYKGLDVLLRALAQVPDVRLVVAGEFWEDEAATRALIADLGLADRVDLRSGYVASSDVPSLFSAADALALPYRASTASAHAYIAHSHGIPVIATTVGTMPEQVRDDVDGLLVPPEDPAALAAAIRRLYSPGVLDRLQAGARDSGARGGEDLWAAYVAAFEAAARQ